MIKEISVFRVLYFIWTLLTCIRHSNCEKSLVQQSSNIPIDPSLDYLDLSLDPRLDHINRIDRIWTGLDQIDHLDLGRDHIDNLSVFSSAGATSLQVLKSSNAISYCRQKLHDNHLISWKLNFQNYYPSSWKESCQQSSYCQGGKEAPWGLRVAEKSKIKTNTNYLLSS